MSRGGEKYRAIAKIVGYECGDSRPNSAAIQSLRRFGMREKDAMLVVAMMARIDRAGSQYKQVLDRLKITLEGLNDAKP